MPGEHHVVPLLNVEAPDRQNDAGPVVETEHGAPPRARGQAGVLVAVDQRNTVVDDTHRSLVPAERRGEDALVVS